MRAKLLSAVLATAVLLPIRVDAQAQRTGEWLQVTPADARTPITPASWDDESGAATAPTVRKAAYRSRADSVAGFRALAASKRDERLRIVISLDDRTLWVRDPILAPVPGPPEAEDDRDAVREHAVARLDDPQSSLAERAAAE